MILMINVKLVKPRDGKVKGTNNQLLYSEFEIEQYSSYLG
jgi:hypothetical protein